MKKINFQGRFISGLKSLLLVAALASGTTASSQMYELGTCSLLSTTTYGPMYSTSNANATSRYATIYPASQLTGIANKLLTSAYYRKSSTTNMNGTPNFKIYLKETTAADLGAGSVDWATLVAGATLVYDSNPNAATAGAAGWKQFEFSNNFTYNGTSNLLVLTEYVAGGNTISNSWYYEYGSPCISTSNNNTSKYITNTTGTLGASLTTSNYRRPQIAFGYFISCMYPSSATVINTTSDSATISWTAPTNAPANGYDIYYSTTNTAPTATTAPTVSGVTTTTYTLTNLVPSTSYYVWVRSNCGSGDVSDWIATPVLFATSCLAPSLLSTTPATVCFNGAATLSATAEPGADVVWYDQPTGGNVLTVGNSFTTPPLTQTTQYYAAASIGTSIISGAKQAPGAVTSSGIGMTTYGIIFDVLAPVTLKSVTLYPVSSSGGANGTVNINVLDSNGTVVASKLVDVVTGTSSAPVPNVVDLDFALPVGIDYKIVPTAKSSSISGLLFDPSSQATNGSYQYPYSVGSYISVKNSFLGSALRPDLYYYFYDWKVAIGCESPRQAVTATVDPNCLGTDEVGAKKEVKVYPNPFTDIINISDIENVKSISVNDASGKLVKVIEKVSDHLNLGDLDKGMYLLNITYNNGKTSNVKVMKK